VYDDVLYKSIFYLLFTYLHIQSERIALPVPSVIRFFKM